MPQTCRTRSTTALIDADTLVPMSRRFVQLGATPARLDHLPGWGSGGFESRRPLQALPPELPKPQEDTRLGVRVRKAADDRVARRGPICCDVMEEAGCS